MDKGNIKNSKSKELYELSKKVLPGGVNSPVRAYSPYPFFTSHAQGCKLFDVDNNYYIDYCLAYGPLILGHKHPQVIKAVKEQLEKGTIYGTPSEPELKLANLINQVFPNIEMLRLVNSGTEATMHAIRAARGFTGKDKIIKFEGCYHGAHDYVLVKAGSGATTFGVPNSIGIPKNTTKNTLVLPFNNIDSINESIKQNREELAAVIIEPVIGNAGLILPEKGYLQEIRKITKEEDILLIFDEIITGFRISLGGAQEYYNVNPDMTTLGKIIGGGFPLAAYGGKKEIMQLISPLGKIYQASTLSGNPISAIAGLETLKVILEGNNTFYKQLEQKCKKISEGLLDLIDDLKLPIFYNHIASMFQIFFTDKPVTNYKIACSSDLSKFKIFHNELLNNNVFIPPSQFEICFISTAHLDIDIEETLRALELALKKITP